MGEDEFELGIKAQQLLFLPHNQVIGTLRVVATSLSIFRCFDKFFLLVDGEIAVMDFGGVCLQVNLIEEVLIVSGFCELGIFLFKHRGIFAFDRAAAFVVLTIMLNAIDEEQA